MNLQEIKKIDKECFMGVYSSRMDICFESGEGCYLYDLDGKEYIDAFAGIAVNCLGYNHPKLTNKICEISKKVMHCSNVFYVKEQAMLEKSSAKYPLQIRCFLLIQVAKQTKELLNLLVGTLKIKVKIDIK